MGVLGLVALNDGLLRRGKAGTWIGPSPSYREIAPASKSAAATMNSALALPEILAVILEWLDDRDDLLACASVCHLWYTWAIEILERRHEFTLGQLMYMLKVEVCTRPRRAQSLRAKWHDIALLLHGW